MFIELLTRRASVRTFTGDVLTQGEIDALLEAALRSPSSRRIDPWEFVVVTDRDTLQGLAEAKPGAEFLAGAALAIAVIADTTMTDVWVEDCSIAASNIWLAATDLGLGACWAQIRNRSHSDSLSAGEYVRQLLAVPDRYAVEAVMGIGRPAPSDAPAPRRAPDRTKIHRERFGDAAKK